MDIVHIKLNNGDDLIGRKIEHDREANQRGAEYYKAFFEEKDESDDYVEYNLEGKTELDREREEMIISYLESKGEVKH